MGAKYLILMILTLFFIRFFFHHTTKEPTLLCNNNHQIQQRKLSARFIENPYPDKTSIAYAVLAVPPHKIINTRPINLDNTYANMPLSESKNPLIFNQYKLVISNESDSPQTMRSWKSDSSGNQENDKFDDAFTIEMKCVRIDGLQLASVCGLNSFWKCTLDILDVKNNRTLIIMQPNDVFEIVATPFASISKDSLNSPGVYQLSATISYVDTASNTVCELKPKSVTFEITEEQIRNWHAADTKAIERK